MNDDGWVKSKRRGEGQGDWSMETLFEGRSKCYQRVQNESLRLSVFLSLSITQALGCSCCLVWGGGRGVAGQGRGAQAGYT